MTKSKTGSKSVSELWVLIAIVSLGIALRATAIAAYGHFPESDELAYRHMALSLSSGKPIVDNMGNYEVAPFV